MPQLSILDVAHMTSIGNYSGLVHSACVPRLESRLGLNYRLHKPGHF